MKHVILGAGPAGIIAAETIRKHAAHDEIVVIGDEPETPYSRMAIPYLLIGKVGEDGTHLRHGARHYQDLRITLRRGVKATAVDTAARRVTLSDGSSESFDKLLIATGSSPASPPVPGIHGPGVHTCWTLKDARAIAALAQPGARVLQMGAGFIGCIIMEALAMRGVKLSVVEMGDRMVPRMMGPTAGGMIKDWCEHKGVTVYTGARVEAIERPLPGHEPAAALAAAPAPAPAPQPGLLSRLAQAVGLAPAPAPAPVPAPAPAASPAAAGAPMTVRLSTGQRLEADLVISATGVRPNIGFLEHSGIRCLVGVLTDEHLQTNVPGIYAAGDCAEAFDKVSGTTIVSAIQPNAAEQARVAALNMVGPSGEQRAELKGVTQINVLDTLGLISCSFGNWQGVSGGEHVELTDRQASGGGRHISLQFKDDRLVGCNAIGFTEHVGVMRGLVEGEVRLTPEWKQRLLQDPTQLMPAYLASAQAQQDPAHAK
ncbi:NAD(P)/FAD-dependent oxidoreductase [Aquabacterium sp. OR-4]|uniref:NAD(P)/FAD-dependent oxidoreductase n=1 Tax=Aquabacterium sp. OR-4 TaxID=2978127 RepID=UPI0028C698C7|nr:FAD-dependent oxidoreductase [Aquabacterium sp. OR-4]MDT7837868.1 FAD-dependent oxidoreductase [Aquabacterium sp. OR-4]